MNTTATPKVPSISLKQVENSSFIAAYGYDAPTQTLRVRFQNSSELHDYGDVTRKQFEDMERAPSVGGFFTKVIRNEKPHTLVPRDDEAEHEGATAD